MTAAPLGGCSPTGECAGEKVRVRAAIPDVSRLLWPSSSRHPVTWQAWTETPQATENKAKASLCELRGTEGVLSRVAPTSGQGVGPDAPCSADANV